MDTTEWKSSSEINRTSNRSGEGTLGGGQSKSAMDPEQVLDVTSDPDDDTPRHMLHEDAEDFGSDGLKPLALLVGEKTSNISICVIVH
jgi:hypothetical protein